MRKIGEMVVRETQTLVPLKIGVIPTLAPYLVPEFIERFTHNYNLVELTISEMPTAMLIDALRKESIQMFIAATLWSNPILWRFPSITRSLLPILPKTILLKIFLSATNMPADNLWGFGRRSLFARSNF